MAFYISCDPLETNAEPSTGSHELVEDDFKSSSEHLKNS